MRLEFLCDLQLTYREEPFYGGILAMVKPYGGEEGSGYGEGEAVLTGEKLSGKMRWVNHPHRRSDAVMLPDLHGIIATDDGAFVLISLQGRTVFQDGMGMQLLTVTLESQDERYRWVNNAHCVLEGIIVGTRGTMRAR